MSLKNPSIVFLLELPSHQDCQQPNGSRPQATKWTQIETKPGLKGQGTLPRSKSLMQTKLVGCIDNVQASVQLIHPCYDKEDRNVGFAILF